MFVQNQDLSERPLELIERELESLAAQIAAGSARWLELWPSSTGAPAGRTPAAARPASGSHGAVRSRPRAAREHVRVARALRELPEIRERFASGELSYSKVRALTRVADADSEAELVELARHATAAQLERMVCAARRVSAAEADQQHRDSYVRWYWDDDDGCLHLDAKLPPTDGALFLRALESARDGLYERRLGEAQEREEDRGGSAGPPAAIRAGRFRGTAASPALALGLASPLPGLAHQRRVTGALSEARWPDRPAASGTARAPSATRWSCTSTPRRSPPTRRARASPDPAPARSPTGRGSRPRPRGGWPATPRS